MSSSPVNFPNTFPMLCNFFALLRARRADSSCVPYVMAEGVESGFPVHPSASELAESLLADPEALKNETYEPGLYDEDGDYYPQYTDDPSKMPEYFAPNDFGETVPESSPAENLSPSDDSPKDE